MAAIILDGKAESARILDEVAAGVASLAKQGKQPCLAAIQANTDPGTDWYAKAQAKHCAQHGIAHRHLRLPPDIAEGDLVAEIEKVSADPEVSGIILFTPLPAGVDYLRLATAIDPVKDAEGVHPANMGRLLVSSHVDPAPCTAMAAMELIKTGKPDLAGARALVIGRSATVGKPLALLLLAEHATVTIAHTRSDLRAAMIEAEVVVAAAGASGARWRAYERKWLAWKANGGERPEAPNLEPLVTMDMVRRGAVVVDVGDNNIPVGLDAEGGPEMDDKGLPNMRYAGDVDFDKVSEVAGYITKPRGSVGPVTNAFFAPERHPFRPGFGRSGADVILLGVDLGDRRVGFAVTDADELLAVPSGFASVRSLDGALAEVMEKAREENAELLVLGHPINMDGRPGPKAKEAARFAEMLREEGFKVELWDERLTTSEAERLLKQAGHNRRQRKTLIDANAAQRLLTSFMSCRKKRD